jgi:hypothetical protein
MVVVPILCTALVCSLVIVQAAFSTAHAASMTGSNYRGNTTSGTTVTTKKIIPLSQAFCTAFAKHYPQLAARIAGHCFATLTSTTTPFLGSTVHNSSQGGLQPASGCPSGSSNHSFSFQTSWWFGAEMVETFTWHGNCSTPSVSGQRCNIGVWTYFPAASASISFCNNWSDSRGNRVAEGDYYVQFTASAGSQTYVAESSANGRSTIISDAYSD